MKSFFERRLIFFAKQPSVIKIRFGQRSRGLNDTATALGVSVHGAYLSHGTISRSSP